MTNYKPYKLVLGDNQLFSAVQHLCTVNYSKVVLFVIIYQIINYVIIYNNNYIFSKNLSLKCFMIRTQLRDEYSTLILKSNNSSTRVLCTALINTELPSMGFYLR